MNETEQISNGTVGGQPEPNAGLWDSAADQDSTEGLPHPSSAPMPVDVKALFMGPKAENADLVERMLLNVRELLTPQDATFADVVQGITYLKCLDDFELFNEILEQHDLTQMPNSIVVADICRPELLCEIEMIAVLPDRNAHVEPILRFGE